MSNNENSISYMVSDTDLKNKIQIPCKVIQLPELNNCNDIIDYLPSDLCCLVMLVETKPHSGHWTNLIRDNNNLIYFDSYGVKPDGELVNISDHEKQLLDEKPILTYLLDQAKDDGFRVSYNKTQFQQYGNGINTCGKWVTTIANSYASGVNLPQYTKMLKQRKKATGLSFDEIVNQLFQYF